jgi:hypothetical protein
MSTLLTKIIALGRAVGPYLALEILLPGGSFIALLLWLYRTRAVASTAVAKRQEPSRANCQHGNRARDGLTAIAIMARQPGPDTNPA